MEDTKREEENEIIRNLLIKKKHWERKRDFYHKLFHKYQRIVNLLWVILLPCCLSLSNFLKLEIDKWILVTFLVLFLSSFASYLYFLKYFWTYENKLENCLHKINQINEKLIEIMVSSRITNPTV